MYIGLHVMKILFSKNTQMSNFIKNPLSGSRVVLCGRTDGQTEMTKLIVASYNFANSLKNEYV